MRVYDFKGVAAAIVTAIRSDIETSFPYTKVVKHDDHWLRPANVNSLSQKVPIVYVSLAGINSENAFDQADAEAAMNLVTQYDIFWIAAADRLGELRGDASDVASYLYAKFTDGDFLIPGYTPPSGIGVRTCSPVRCENYNELLDLGFVGLKASLEIETVH